MQEGSHAVDQMIPPTSFRLPQQHTSRKGFQCKSFIWEAVPRNTGSKAEKESSRWCYQATYHREHLDLSLAGTVSDSAELHLTVLLPNG